jgi:crossover junction endodeoxyribonuclease RuvC
MARGVVLLAARKALIDVFEYTPKKVKVAVTGNGNASKPQVQSMVQYLFRLPKPPTPWDAADALALTICHNHAVQTQKFIGAKT